ncbi:hypothetical protein EAS54_18495 [Bradyrhizobium guangzhouense]|uniref:Uncharacterized protein n=2 Tax=Bradyrhizobium guangzhouense TaxID=1325095 RepID=A0AAE5X5I9_9BRAD|nr:hypothetical protein XH91_30345 [Bradyrhizobium guangzhouense]RXH15728.1 hypothetical protein EAS54_18495 [Bradyrhizobium guangzhouense]RXH15934.1 hypothetical protein EAS56_07915 [Bradyrhizobium guangzhouense]
MPWLRFCAWLRDGCGHGFVRGNAMISSAHARTLANLAGACCLALLLGACGGGGLSLPSFSSSQPAPEAEPGVAPEMPASIRADEIVGRWGLASFQNPADRARTEAAARAQCKNPYVIGAGSSGGVIMHLADQATPQELRLKGSPTGKNYIGPSGPTPGEQDREIVSFDGRVMITRFVDKDAATRYGNMVYVRCGPKA